MESTTESTNRDSIAILLPGSLASSRSISVDASSSPTSSTSTPDVYSEKNADPRMDGGPRAWATLVGGFLITMVTFGYANAFGVYQDIYTRSGTASASRISWIGSTQVFFLLAMGLPAGKLLDMGYFHHTALAGSVIFVTSLFMVSLAHHDQYYQIYLCQGLGVGIGAGLLYVPAMAIQAHHWRARRALAMGIVITGSSIGGIIFPIMLNQLFKGSIGFAWGVRASAFLCLGLLAFANALMSTNPAILSQTKPMPDIKVILTDVPYLLAAFSTLIIFWGFFFPYFYLQLFAIFHRVDFNIAFYTISIMNASSFFGRIIPNHFADKLGPINCAIPLTLINGILIFAMFGINSVASAIIFSILYGFLSGAVLSLCAPILATFARDPSEIGVRFGVAFFIASFGALTGPPIIGDLLGSRFQWYKAIVFSAVVVILGALLLIPARYMVVKRKGTQLV